MNSPVAKHETSLMLLVPHVQHKSDSLLFSSNKITCHPVSIFLILNLMQVSSWKLVIVYPKIRIFLMHELLSISNIVLLDKYLSFLAVQEVLSKPQTPGTMHSDPLIILKAVPGGKFWPTVKTVSWVVIVGTSIEVTRAKAVVNGCEVVVIIVTFSRVIEGNTDFSGAIVFSDYGYSSYGRASEGFLFRC